jgi:hypothetical protein
LKLYENVVIGNFLYGLGLAVGAKANTSVIPSIVSLLQQTPADKLLCDLLLEFPGVVRLIEFKTRENKSKKEIRKHSLLKISIGDDKKIIKLAKSTHWFIETDPDKNSNNFISRIVPYLDAYPEDEFSDSLEHFIEKTAEDVINNNTAFSQEDLKYYLSLVAGCQGAGEVNTGGLLLVIDSSGGLRFVELTDMMQLRLQHKEFVKEVALKSQQLIEADRMQVEEISQELHIYKEQDHSLER